MSWMSVVGFAIWKIEIYIFIPLVLDGSYVVVPYSSTDNLLSPILVSDWFIFCCGNLMKNKTKKPKSICKHKVACFTLNSPPMTSDITCSKL